MQRVMICGGPGSGKSTLARIMGERLGLPAYHMDHIHWTPGWVERDKAAKTPLVMEIIAKDAWVFEGGHSKTHDDRAARSDTFIWLDLPLVLRFYRVVWRSLRDFGKVRPDMADGCPETFGKHTLEFWWWIWTTRHSKRARMQRIIEEFPHLKVYHLQTRSQVAAFIANLPRKAEAL
ncbi:AAA family ATPase [Cognatiyoonia sp. IB215446]|uniref:AAA family ATPase n=1 Tax=Cognatiyoonia sp. IB215446 TaxID=3097355 RepID=UPI002A14256D|nr:AAA family ATPase [Cognatiyoonia sp. IB215446]MDX8346450.1 AAA family ATPase [Cognatiyoonia sp. IB215446]